MESNKNCPSLWDGLDRGPKSIHPQARVPWSAIELTASGGAFGFDLRLKSSCPLFKPQPQPQPHPPQPSPPVLLALARSHCAALCRMVTVWQQCLRSWSQPDSRLAIKCHRSSLVLPDRDCDWVILDVWRRGCEWDAGCNCHLCEPASVHLWAVRCEVWKVFSCWLIVDFKLGIPNQIYSDGRLLAKSLGIDISGRV